MPKEIERHDIKSLARDIKQTMEQQSGSYLAIEK